MSGIFTDSDLARLFESRRDAALDGPIGAVMTARPCTVPQGSMMADAVAIMAERKISELPVVDALGKPVGLVDITDVVGLFPDMDPPLPALHTAPVILSTNRPAPRPRTTAFGKQTRRRDRR